MSTFAILSVQMVTLTNTSFKTLIKFLSLKIEQCFETTIFLAVQDSSKSDIVCRSVCQSQLTIRAYNRYIHYNHYNHYNHNNRYRDSDLDWKRFSELVTYWHSWLLLTNCETWIITLRSSDLQSDGDVDSIRNSCDVFTRCWSIEKKLSAFFSNLTTGFQTPKINWEVNKII